MIRVTRSWGTATVSETFDYYFNSDFSISELADTICEKIGCHLVPLNPDLYLGRLFGMEFSLSTNNLENDRDVNLKDYAYELSTRTPWALAHLRAIQVQTLALAAFVLHTELGIHEGMLTHESETVLARYQMRGTTWYDLIEESEVRYPDHLVSISWDFF